MCESEKWVILYSILGAIFLILFFYYGLYIIPDLRAFTPKLPGYRSSQILFLVSLFLRAVGYIVWAALFKDHRDDHSAIISTIFCGIPGYVLTISYCLIFFLWCTILANLILNDSSNYFKKIGFWSFAIGLVIVIMCIILIIVVILTDKNNYGNYEVSLAIGRDILTALVFIYFCSDMIKKHKKPMNTLSTASTLSWLSICLIISLIIRAISTVLYRWAPSFGFKNGKPDYGTGSFINTLIAQLVGEIIPCFLISINRKKSGLLSVYDEFD